jgi:hypothetical protein
MDTRVGSVLNAINYSFFPILQSSFILKWIREILDGLLSTGLIWLRIWTSRVHL